MENVFLLCFQSKKGNFVCDHRHCLVMSLDHYIVFLFVLLRHLSREQSMRHHQSALIIHCGQEFYLRNIRKLFPFSPVGLLNVYGSRVRKMPLINYRIDKCAATKSCDELFIKWRWLVADVIIKRAPGATDGAGIKWATITRKRERFPVYVTSAGLCPSQNWSQVNPWIVLHVTSALHQYSANVIDVPSTVGSSKYRRAVSGVSENIALLFVQCNKEPINQHADDIFVIDD